MSEKIQKVNKWLSTVFGDQAIPHFEVNTRTVDILYQLAESSEIRCKDITLLTDDLKQKAVEYQADGVHLQDVLLQGAGLSYASLSKPACDYLSALVDNAMILGTRDTSLSSFVPAVNSLTNELLEADKLDRQLDRELKALRKRLGATLVLRKTLQEDITRTAQAQEIESAKAEERLLNKDFLKAKSQELICRRKRAEDHLISRNMEKTLTHQAINELSEEVTALKRELLPLTKKLEPYLDLSPNPSLAKVKVEEAKRELAALDAQIEMNVDFMQK